MKKFLLLLVMLLSIDVSAINRERQNFNAGWLMAVGDWQGAEAVEFNDRYWERVTLPRAFNGHEAFARDIVDLTDTIVWYRKHFRLQNLRDKKVFVEFEGVRQGGEFWMNGHRLGMSTNGVMACGFDLTRYAQEGENVIAVRVDNSWTYRDPVLNCRYQWNDRNFNANYGGIPKNAYLHQTDRLYQTLPLYSNLGTTGTYIYATDFDIPGHRATIHAESEVRNDDTRPRSFNYYVQIQDPDGHLIATLHGDYMVLQPGETRTVHIQQEVSGLHFWSWGFGYLYLVTTRLQGADGTVIDEVVTRTGFRKTRFAEGKIWLNDRCLMIHGYAQRSSNEWPGVGLSVPAWLSDYSNGLMVESGGNLVRWMHVTPWKQDVESCDRVGLLQAMPAGDSEKDVEGAPWQQRTQLMRDAIIYNRNNPSIIFYESGNKSISREHMLEMKALRDQYDPHGGRAIGSREMLDIDEADYGGEMLYINKSQRRPMWAMEYCRDEGLRKYWDEQSYPYHREGSGPLYRGQPAPEYNHNMDEFAVEMVRRWYDYWQERPGTATRVSSGGVKIVFSDTNTHHRGESNYRMSGVTDAMRIPKNAFFAHQVMWTGWVDDEYPATYIVGHWNYPTGTVKKVYVISNADDVELFLNDRSLGHGRREYNYLFTFDSVHYEPGGLRAVGYTEECRVSDYQLTTAGEPHHLRLTAIQNPEGAKADGADMVIIQAEVVDEEGRRCPLDDRILHFSLSGEGTWIGGIGTRNNRQFHHPNINLDPSLIDDAAQTHTSDNYVGATSLPVECGVCRILVRTTTRAGTIHVAAAADGLGDAEHISVRTSPVDVFHYLPSLSLKGRFIRGETPLTPSFQQRTVSVPIASATAGYDSAHAVRSFDDNELSEWKNDGHLSTGWITYQLARRSKVEDICMKLTGWRQRSYQLEIVATNLDEPTREFPIWSGETPRSLGYIHLKPTNIVTADEITIRLRGAGKDDDAFGGIVEVTEPAAGELDLFKAKDGNDAKNELRIVEIEFLERKTK